MYKLLNKKLKQTCCDKELFPFNYLGLEQTFSEVVCRKVISKDTAKKLACTGLSFHHIELAIKRDKDNGVKTIMQVHGLKGKKANVFRKFFIEKEE